MIGEPSRFAFELREAEPHPDVRGLGWAGLVLWIGGERAWSGPDDGFINWTWIDSVEHLAESWGPLLCEEVPPFGLVADGPEYLREHRFLKGVSGRSPLEVEEAVHAYQQRHDLAAGLKGVSLEPVWLLREGKLVRVRWKGRDHRMPFEEIVSILEEFVSAVLVNVGDKPAARAKYALERWNSRAPAQDRLLSLRTTLSPARLRELTPADMPLEEFWGKAAIDEDPPMMAAARLSQPLSDLTQKELLKQVYGMGHTETPELDALSAAAAPVEESTRGLRPWAQGYTIALWLRKTLGREEGPIDPEELLASWKVEVGELPPMESQLDAIACWGVGKGPTILVNPAGLHANSPGGRRSTLAHEIAHLLVDRAKSLPAIDVVGGGTPLFLEQRARAFAAEFLLPREDAASAVARAGSLASAATAILAKYGVSNEVLGWQLLNGAAFRLLTLKEQRTAQQWTRPAKRTTSRRSKAGKKGRMGQAIPKRPARAGRPRA